MIRLYWAATALNPSSLKKPHRVPIPPQLDLPLRDLVVLAVAGNVAHGVDHSRRWPIEDSRQAGNLVP